MKILYNLANLFGGRLHKENIAMENLQRVQQMVDTLNQQTRQAALPQILEDGGWYAEPGYFAVTKFEFGRDGKGAAFTPSYGIPLKVFTNRRTGEVKMYVANMFEE